MALHTGRRRLSRLCAMVFVLVLALAGFGASQVARASSSGGNRIDLQPGYGLVGTQVDVSVTLYTAPSGQQLRLTAAPLGTSSDCLASKPIPGVAPYYPPSVLPATTRIQITWPAVFAHGQYTICALATGDNSVVAYSYAPFTVDDGTSPPTPTLAPTPSPTLAPLANILDNTSNILPGSDVHIEINHWSAPDPGTGAPIQVELLSAVVVVDGPQVPATMINSFSIESQLPYSSLLTFTLPLDTIPGAYRVAISEKGGFVAVTQPFRVVSTAPTQSLRSRGRGYPSGLPIASFGPTPITLLVAGLLLVAVLMLIGPSLRRRLRR